MNIINMIRNNFFKKQMKKLYIKIVIKSLNAILSEDVLI